jgi:hypothetical protein
VQLLLRLWSMQLLFLHLRVVLLVSLSHGT